MDALMHLAARDDPHLYFCWAPITARMVKLFPTPKSLAGVASARRDLLFLQNKTRGGVFSNADARGGEGASARVHVLISHLHV